MRVHAPTEDEALAAWRDAVAERPPRPPPPVRLEDPERDPWERDVVEFPETPAPVWPDPRLANTPAVVVPLAPCPLPENAWGSWMRALGPHGESVFALQRFQPDGFILVGQDVADRVDLDGLEAALDRADARIPDQPRDESEAWKGEAPARPCLVVTYRIVNEATGESIEPAWQQVHRSNEFDSGPLLDGDRLRRGVFRQRWV